MENLEPQTVTRDDYRQERLSPDSHTKHKSDTGAGQERAGLAVGVPDLRPTVPPPPTPPPPPYAKPPPTKIGPPQAPLTPTAPVIGPGREILLTVTWPPSTNNSPGLGGDQQKSCCSGPGLMLCFVTRPATGEIRANQPATNLAYKRRCVFLRWRLPNLPYRLG